MTVISVINQKGGVGKSTLALNLGFALHQNNKKVLLIDLDPQGHLGLSLGIDKDNLRQTIFQALDIRNSEPHNIYDTVIHLEKGLDLIPSNIELSTLELILANRPGRESRMRDVIRGISSEYNYVIIDCPPNLGLLTINALVSSQNVIVPFDTSLYAMDGINYLNSTLEMLYNKINHNLHVKYVLNNYDPSNSNYKALPKQLVKQMGDTLFKTVVRRSASFEQAARSRRSVVKSYSKTSAAKDIVNLAKELIKWIERPIHFISTDRIKAAQHHLRKKPVTFRLKNQQAKEIKLAGTFNNWDAANCHLKKISQDGLWEVTLPLGKGRHNYKFIVDGHWMEDQSNPEKEEIAQGIYNSVVVVK